MYALLIGLVLYLPAIALCLLNDLFSTPGGTGADVIFILSMLAGSVFTGGNLIFNFSEVSEQIKDIEEIEEYKERKKVFIRRRNDLLSQVVLYLGDKYPAHEKEIFKLISEKNNEAAVTLVTAIPELRTVDAFKELVNKLQEYNGRIYDQDLAILRCKRRIRVRKRSPWLTQYLFPSYDDTQDLLKAAKLDGGSEE